MRKTFVRTIVALLALILLVMAGVPVAYAEEPGEIGNVSVSDEGIITWDTYPGAAEYRVGIQWFYKTTTDTTYDLQAYIDELVAYDQIDPSGYVSLTVRAYDSGGNMIAEWANNSYSYKSDAEVIPKGTIQNVKINDEGILSWDAWPNTQLYWVGINGGYRTSPDEAPLTYDVDAYLDEFESYGDLVKEGSHEMEIEAISVEGYEIANWEGFVHVAKNGEGWKYSLFASGENVRLAGSNRYATAIEAAEHLKKMRGISRFDNIIVASGADFPDALSASYLAVWKKAPILLVNSGSMGTVAEYIGGNLAAGGKVYIIGGTGAVSQAAEDAIVAKTGTDAIVRFSGKNRYETNLLVLKECDKDGGLTGQRLIFASGKGFADALSASATGKPIMLVGDVLLPDQIDLIKEIKPELDSGNMYIAGGTGAVSQAVEDTLSAPDGLALDIKRYAGANRFETSYLIASDLFATDLGMLVIANAMNFPDGLSGGPIGAYYYSPLILVTDSMYDYAASKYWEASCKRLVIMGGTGVVSDATVEAIAAD